MNGTATFSDFCELVTQQINPTEVDEEVVYLGLEHLGPGRMRPVAIGRASEVQSQKFAFRSGDVLYSKLRPYLDKAILAETNGVCSTELLVFRPRPGVDPRFLACLVHAPDFVEHAMSGVTGANHPRTSWQHVSQFPVLSLDEQEQRTNGEILWRVHDLMIACESSEHTAQELKRAAMREIFTRGIRDEPLKETEIGLVPESWIVDPLGAHHSLVSGGTPSRSNPDFWVGGTIPWVKTGEVDYCLITQTEENITPYGLENSAARLLPVGTLLMAMYGQGMTRGKVAILGIEATCNQASAAITANDNSVLTRYLYHFLAWRYEAIRSMAHGGQQQNLNLDIVRDLLLAYPRAAEEQEEIVAIFDVLDRKIELHRKKRAVLEELFRTLLHELVTGEIRLNERDLTTLAAGE
jgi:type I restriction enzyme S subunit